MKCYVHDEHGHLFNLSPLVVRENDFEIHDDAGDIKFRVCSGATHTHISVIEARNTQNNIFNQTSGLENAELGEDTALSFSSKERQDSSAVEAGGKLQQGVRLEDGILKLTYTDDNPASEGCSSVTSEIQFICPQTGAVSFLF